MEEQTQPITPPSLDESTDGSRDAELLRAISAHPELAHALAEIAGGRPAREALLPLLGPEPEPPGAEATEPETTEPQPEAAKPETQPEVAMYQSPALAARKPAAETGSFPTFLSTPHQDFWDGFGA